MRKTKPKPKFPNVLVVISPNMVFSELPNLLHKYINLVKVPAIRPKQKYRFFFQNQF